MNCTLTRISFLETGIFGELDSEDESLSLFTLERAFENPDGSWGPKIPPGTYTCSRYLSPKFGYYVFQVNNVPGHANIEIHRANVETQLDGCIALGLSTGALNGLPAVLQSKDAFNIFMNKQVGIESFILTVI